MLPVMRVVLVVLLGLLVAASVGLTDACWLSRRIIGLDAHDLQGGYLR